MTDKTLPPIFICASCGADRWRYGCIPPFRLKFRPPLSGHLNGFARHHAERQSIDDADGTETARSMNPARDFAAGIKTGDGLMRAHVGEIRTPPIV